MTIYGKIYLLVTSEHLVSGFYDRIGYDVRRYSQSVCLMEAFMTNVLKNNNRN